jgi:hypothetical protein
MGIVVKWTPRTDSDSAGKSPPQKAAVNSSDVIVFPRVRIAELRALWETMKQELEDTSERSFSPWSR